VRILLIEDEPGIAEFQWAALTPDGAALVFAGNAANGRPRVYVKALSGGAARPVTPQGVGLWTNSISPLRPGSLCFGPAAMPPTPIRSSRRDGGLDPWDRTGGRRLGACRLGGGQVATRGGLLGGEIHGGRGALRGDPHRTGARARWCRGWQSSLPPPRRESFPFLLFLLVGEVDKVPSLAKLTTFIAATIT